MGMKRIISYAKIPFYVMVATVYLIYLLFIHGPMVVYNFHDIVTKEKVNFVGRIAEIILILFVSILVLYFIT
jgi:hypothetical protein